MTKVNEQIIKFKKEYELRRGQITISEESSCFTLTTKRVDECEHEDQIDSRNVSVGGHHRHFKLSQNWKNGLSTWMGIS